MAHVCRVFSRTRVPVTRENWILFAGTMIPVINLRAVESPRRRYIMQPRYVIPSLLATKVDLFLRKLGRFPHFRLEITLTSAFPVQ